jgi:hypothetical protein
MSKQVRLRINKSVYLVLSIIFVSLALIHTVYFYYSLVNQMMAVQSQSSTVNNLNLLGINTEALDNSIKLMKSFALLLPGILNALLGIFFLLAYKK